MRTAHRVAAGLALVGLLASACTRPLPQLPTPTAVAASAESRQDIVAAATAYVRSHAQLTEFVVDGPTVSGDYARVRVLPAQNGAPPLWVFLLRQGVNWQGLTVGPSLGAASYDLFGIPPELRLPTGSTPAGGR